MRPDTRPPPTSTRLVSPSDVPDLASASTNGRKIWRRSEIATCFRLDSQAVVPRTAVVAAEVPVALAYNGLPHVVMMSTPSDLTDFAIGFSISEGILASAQEVLDLAVQDGETGIRISMMVAPERFARLQNAIFVIGQNPGTNSPRMMPSLREAARRGVPIVAMNPLRERALERFAAPQDPVEMATFTSTRIASEYCQVRVGGDVAAVKGVMKLVLEAHEAALRAGDKPVLDLSFIEQHTFGFDALAEDLRRTSWDDILRVSGLPRAQIERVGQIYMQSKSVIICFGMGLTQHRYGTENVQQIANLLMMRGNFGRAGAGICPVRGHSNVQGDRTVGIDEKPSAELLDPCRCKTDGPLNFIDQD